MTHLWLAQWLTDMTCSMTHWHDLLRDSLTWLAPWLTDMTCSVTHGHDLLRDSRTWLAQCALWFTGHENVLCDSDMTHWQDNVFHDSDMRTCSITHWEKDVLYDSLSTVLLKYVWRIYNVYGHLDVWVTYLTYNLRIIWRWSYASICWHLWTFPVQNTDSRTHPTTTNRYLGEQETDERWDSLRM